jgi:hypothetical protein
MKQIRRHDAKAILKVGGRRRRRRGAAGDLRCSPNFVG